VLRTLDRYAERYGAKDADDVTDLFADDPDVLLIGTGADERWIGKAEVRLQFLNGTSPRRSARDSSGARGT